MSKKQKYVIVLLVILLGAFLRFYRLKETTVFLGDQGKELIGVSQSLNEKRLPLVGPLSNEGVHAGPTYYYLLAFPLIINRYQPFGPILLITFLGVLSLCLFYFLSLRFFGFFPALTATVFYAFSPAIIKQTIGLWNPIPIPFFSLLLLLSLYQIEEKKKLPWFLALGFFLSFAIQLYAPAFFCFGR